MKTASAKCLTSDDAGQDDCVCCNGLRYAIRNFRNVRSALACVLADSSQTSYD